MLNLNYSWTFPEILTLKEVFQIASNGKLWLLCTVISCSDPNDALPYQHKPVARFYVIIKKKWT